MTQAKVETLYCCADCDTYICDILGRKALNTWLQEYALLALVTVGKKKKNQEKGKNHLRKTYETKNNHNKIHLEIKLNCVSSLNCKTMVSLLAARNIEKRKLRFFSKFRVASRLDRGGFLTERTTNQRTQ